MCEEALTVLHPRQTRGNVGEGFIELSQKCLVIDHLTEGIHLPPQAALDKFASEL